MGERFTIRRAQRKQARFRCGIAGPSGSGKTYSAILLAMGLATDPSKIAVIDTEHNSAELYDHLCEWSHLGLDAPYTAERYIDALKQCEDEGFEVVIIDSISHLWSGTGGLLQQKELAERRGKNAYTAWGEVTPKFEQFVEAILSSKCHVICTMRSKTHYALISDDKTGRTTVTKLGLKPIQREGIDYEFTMMLEMNGEDNSAVVTKNRTGLFEDGPFVPTPEAGRIIREWLESGAVETPMKEEPRRAPPTEIHVGSDEPDFDVVANDPEDEGGDLF